MLSDNERPTQGRGQICSVSPQAKTATLLNPRVAVLFCLFQFVSDRHIVAP
jgi:hypothetical protein